MKLRFTKTQLEWLNAWLNATLVALGPTGMTDGQRRLFARLRYKFTPNASVVWLKNAERELVVMLVMARARALNERGITSPELHFLHTLLRTLQGRGADNADAEA